jgi:acyl-CoA synthetase (AMP-forming)/AMP-acid ligase II
MGVGCISENGPEFLVILFAIVACGAVAVPLPPTLSRSEVDALEDELGLSAWLATREFAARFECLAISDEFALRSLEGKACCPHIPNAAIIRPTSGTTARAKGVVLSHETIFERTEAARVGLGLEPEQDIVCTVLPMAQHFVVSLLTYVRYGIEIATTENALAPSITETLVERKCTVLYAAPIHFALLAADPEVCSVPSLRLTISTSAALSAGVAERFRGRFGIRPRQVYGIIELGLPLGNLHGRQSDVSTVGFPLPGFEAKFVDTEGNESENGELMLRGPGMFDGYLRPPQRKNEILDDGWFATGDLAERLSDGAIRVHGRKKSVIITAGNKVFPEEIESVLDSVPTIRASRVFAETHPLFGEMVVAEVELLEGADRNENELRRFCRSRLSSHKVPQRIEFVKAIQKTVTGKAKRHL